MIKNEQSDIELYNDYINGNNDAFNIIVNRYRKKLISYIRRYVKNIETAEDISQEVFIYMFKSKKKYDFTYKFETYMYRIAKSRALNYIRRVQKECYLNHETIYKIDYIDDMDSILIKKEEIEKLLQNLNSLKKEYRDALYLKELKGFNYKEICYIMGKNMNQVKSLIHRARKALKQDKNSK